VEGIKKFQIRHGLTADGVLGKATAAALNVPLGDRVRQIEFALERLRWLPHLGAGRFIGVNVPMFRLWAWDDLQMSREPSLTMNVIVGKAPSTRTPVLASEIEQVVARPYWNVPVSIARGELIPAWRRDHGYFDRHALELVAGAGDAAPVVPATETSVAELEQGRLRLRQRPGPNNSLGLLKFIFPNEESVYLHGTPATELFNRSRRDFSHGCVRVEDPLALAEWLLDGQAGWTRDRIVEATGRSRPSAIRLAKPVQVILFYITAAVFPEDGAIHFADDIYGHDVILDRALRAD
jgi:murein L,D-transpeptidase YcbB/YkuD